MVERTSRENDAINEFLSRYFPTDYAPDDSELSDRERDTVDIWIDDVDSEFDSAKGYLGLAIDFLLIAEELSKGDSWLDEFNDSIDRNDIFQRYDEAATAATLTLEYQGVRAGIRPVHERITDLFREELQRTNFPSAAPHYTGEWERYEDWLVVAFSLSRQGRYRAVQRLFDIGLEGLEARTHTTRSPPYPQPFKRIVQDYRRKDEDEEAGSAYQAMAYGYVNAEWPHLSITASKLRTGSSRQHRYGDVDGFYGPDLMISVEAKDKIIDSSNVNAELGTMMELATETTAIAIAMCHEVDDDARMTLEESEVEIITDAEIIHRLRTWDYHKQDRALQGMIHFLANIEENPSAVHRLLQFIEEVDPNNTALAHL